MTDKRVLRNERSKRRANRRSIILAFIVVCIVSSFAMFNAMTLQKENAKVSAEIEYYEGLVAQEKEKSTRLKEYSEYTRTEEFAKWYAKNKLGLIDDNEIIIKGE